MFRFPLFLFILPRLNSVFFPIPLQYWRLSFCICTEMAFQIKRDILFQAFLCSLFSILMTSQGVVTDIFCLKSVKDSLEDPSNFLSFKGGLIVGFAFSLTCSVMVACVSYYSNCAPCLQPRKKRNSHLRKAKELGKYICSTIRRRTRRVANQMYELLHMQLVEKESKEVRTCSLFISLSEQIPFIELSLVLLITLLT